MQALRLGGVRRGFSATAFQREEFRDFVHRTFNQREAKTTDMEINNLMQQLKSPRLDFQEMMKGIKKMRNKTQEELKKEMEQKVLE